MVGLVHGLDAVHGGLGDAFGGGDEEVAFGFLVFLDFDPAVGCAPGDGGLDAGAAHGG